MNIQKTVKLKGAEKSTPGTRAGNGSPNAVNNFAEPQRGGGGFPGGGGGSFPGGGGNFPGGEGGQRGGGDFGGGQRGNRGNGGNNNGGFNNNQIGRASCREK